ncbi:UPF0103-domain-containing protein [Linderina pennispora]|uniref:UPF0103-domain-containing protein n=1 Tax=Linderina pennispora TaxID=61395 RepID=A0A1Y1WFM0_9FUNG|nr:UPF0103-domain-containing protein [Linderina pennispora]ORX72299.1 UPF0103-domain-containing protein [Linderina pennispora]
MTSRKATHAGSWYTESGDRLDRELQGWLNIVPAAVEEIVPAGGTRAIIGPHAGYSYSGPNAAYAYKCVDIAKVKRVFLLGPSHHIYLDNCALSACSEYETPLGNIAIDKDTIGELRGKGTWRTMSLEADEDEHSLEMHLPYIYKTFESKIQEIKLVPILVGNLSFQKEKYYGEILAPYLDNEENLFVISSDFCHWGSRFRFTYYRGSEQQRPVKLQSSDRRRPDGKPIWQSIERLDWDGMEAIVDTDHSAFRQYLEETGNTICGRHPIGVLLAAVNHLFPNHTEGPVLRFVKYDQSSKVAFPTDSSVSYASAYLALP